ncbi:hypothetical protein TREES_T100011621 [Tupaia chinensis]|uniref:Uncharacterized protein n=1 Tax=Tupaia chinensis TaxID=246437 RepID=L9L900_TUPCH|nr:hypothetical protein TREES_T100011621 [Tupaia chinensis]
MDSTKLTPFSLTEESCYLTSAMKDAAVIPIRRPFLKLPSDDRVPVRDQNSLSAEDVLKKHTLKGMIPLQSWTDAASIPERRRGKQFTSRKGAALERALEGPRQQVGL